MFQKRNKEKKRRISVIEQQGFATENHTVTTEDGYILVLERLMRSGTIPPEGRPPVLFVHGFLCKGDNWCLMPADEGLPYLLLEKGFDVWLLNLRGTPLSKKHTYLKTESAEYWDFSFHEMGVYDVPASINYILDLTESKSVAYIGHSMGCSILLVMLSTLPEFNDKINLAVLLAPAVYGKSIRHIGFKQLMYFGNCVGASKFIRKREFGSSTVNKTVKYVTTKSTRDTVGAAFIQFMGNCFGGFGKNGIGDTNLRKMSREFPSPTSIKLFCHGVQIYKTDKARQYNYGRKGNLKMYGQKKPPEYEMEKVTAPVAIFNSAGDELCRPDDTAKLLKKLPNVVHHQCIDDKKFSHIDFLAGQTAKSVVFDKVIESLMERKTERCVTQL